MTDLPQTDPVTREPRDSVFLSAIVERFGGAGSTKHRVRDLSPGGVRIDQAAGFTAGATVLVSVGALASVAATVAWVKDGLAGLTFARPIKPEDARAKAAHTSRSSDGNLRPATSTAPTAGWMGDLDDPYRR